MTLEDEVRAELRGLEDQHRLRVPRILDGSQGPTALVDGERVINLSSNDYLSLAGDRRLVAAMHAALDEGGAGAGASRLIVGNHRSHVALEEALAEWLRVGGVRGFSSGYAANIGVLTSLLRDGDVVFSDELNHASLVDGCRLSRAKIVVYRHGDLAALEQQLRDHPGRRRVVVSESLFSMDGDVVDVAGLVAVARRHEAVVVLDEAHAIGARGPEGRGIAAEVGVVPDVVVGTFGKAFGCYGAFAATTRVVADLLWNRARTFVFTTGLPPVVPGAALAALEIIRGGDGDERRRRLAANARAMRQRLGLGDGSSPIVPIVLGGDARTMAVSRALFEARVFVQGIRPPTVPEGTARLRVSVAAGHTIEEIGQAAEIIDDAVRCST